MGAMRQNMNKLQDMLRQMQEQQQAYEVARQAKTTSAAPPHPSSATWIAPPVASTQAFIQAALHHTVQASATTGQS
jgi:hypothetical protein